jgi:16S rRNA (adenine1518-N6/adenine1519-N6)-dimethyltransferase
LTSPRRILSERGLRPQKGRGQNFLADDNTASKIVTRAGLNSDLPVLEIGPGLGALTGPLLSAGYRVHAVEVDAGLAQYLNDNLAPRFAEQLHVQQADILDLDPRKTVEDMGGRISVIGNLPYVISSPVLFWLLDAGGLIDRAVVMLQRELADRLTASPGNKNYGRLTVILGYYADVRTLMQVNANVFHPRPKVGSTVVAIEFKTDPRPPLKSDELFRQIVAAGFAMRRKKLANALSARFDADVVRAALATADIEPDRRAESLSVSDFVGLANAWSND